jgi:protein phosphatase
MSQESSTALHVSVAMGTDIGRKRKQNQDAIGHLTPTEPEILAELGQVFVLADGVGGLERGDLASQYAVSTIISSYYEQESGEPPERLARAISEANTVIYGEGQGQEPPALMATTVVAAIVRGRDLVVGSVGDSPAYLLRESQARKLTQDHTVEMLQAEEGIVLPDGDENGQKLVRALGTQPSVKVDIISGRVRLGDYVLLCSDGLTRYLEPEEIEQTIAAQPIESAVTALIDLANERGGMDNISVILLRMDEEDELAHLLAVRDPMETWGRPRRAERAERTRPRQPTVRLPVQEAPTATDLPPVENPLDDVLRFLRGNTMLTGIGIAVLLVVFVIIMLVLANQGGGSNPPGPTAIPAQDRTQTVVVQITATAQVIAAQTNDAILQATSAQSARMTMTPPTAVPTSGPQMTDGTWFKVLEGDPITAYQSPSLDADGATALEADENYRITLVSHDVKNGPWYQVVDAFGEEVRWVNAPSLHNRIVAVDLNGSPLPADQQPVDVSLPGELAPTTPLPARTPGEPTPTGTAGPTPTTRPDIPYGEETWEPGQEVVLKDDLKLCRVPDVNACDAGTAQRDETATIVSGPTPSGDHWWWKVEFEDGRTGWIAQVLLGTP